MLYFFLNTAALVAAGFVSFRALLFFVFFILFIWLYSSSLKRLFWISNLIASALVVFPFFAIITLYFRNFQLLIVYHALYLFVLILIRDIIMDFETTKAIGGPPPAPSKLFLDIRPPKLFYLFWF